MFNFIKKAFSKAVSFVKETANTVYSSLVKAVSSVISFFRPRIIGTNHQPETVVA